jgi:hypothetical protein
MRKAKAAIDPGVLAKLRAAIQNSPMASQLMGNVYVKEEEKGGDSVQAQPKPKAPVASIVTQEKAAASADMPLSQKQSTQPTKRPKSNERALEAAKKAHAGVKEPEVEAVDQGKMLDIVAKMLELNPHKAGLKKGVKDILKDK